MADKIIDIEELAQDQRNFNKGTEEGAELMERSFKELGAGRSVLVDKNGNIIAGNKSQKAAMAAGISKVRVIETDGTELVAVKRTDIDIDSAEGRRLAFLDNLTTQKNLAWDEVELQAVQADVEGFDVEDFGFEFEPAVSPDDFGEDFSLPEGDHTDFRRYGFMLHDTQYERAVIALKMAKADEGFKAYCDAQQNTNENGNALSYIFQQWVEQKKLSSK